MMTKQAELKKQAYASTLKSRALSVLIYLIDRSNKELTCFPAIPTMAEQLHISISTVKRALHELLDAGYVKKDARFREKNKGQTSNLYTLVLFEGQPVSEASHGGDCDNYAGIEPSGEVSQEREDKLEQEVCCHSSNYLEPFSSVYLDVLSGSDSVLVRLNGGYSA